MIVQTVKVNDCTPQTIVIGRRGTYDTMQIAFDLSYLVEAYGDGVTVLAVKRSQDSSAYPAVTSQEDDLLLWTVSETDTYYVGAGECQLMWYVDGGLAKTIIYPMVVMKDILMTSEEAPDAYQEWVDALIAEGAETLQNAQNAAQSASDAESAKDDAVAAKEAAEAALEEFTTPTASATTLSAGSQATATYSDGNFAFGIPRGADGSPGTPGTPGADGVTPDFSIGTVTTLEPTQPATATITGTAEAPVLNLGIPKGAKGDPGQGGGSVDSVNGQTGDVVLDAGDLEFDDTETYAAGSVGAELSAQSNAISQKAPVIINTASGDIASFADGADGMQIRKIVGTIVPMQSGTGDPSPDNVRPISGWTGANIEQRGKNRYDVSKITTGKYLNSDGSTTDSSGWDISDYMEINNESVFITGVGTPGTAPKSCWFDANKAFLSSFANQAGSTLINKPSGAKYLRLSIYNDDKNNIEAYDGARTLPINWQSEAGTIYGGTITLNEDGSADVVSTCGIVDLSTLTWSIYYGVFSCNTGANVTTDINARRCSCYKNFGNVPLSQVENIPNYNIARSTSAGYVGAFLIKDNRFDNVSDFTSAITGQMFVYEITPVTYHFDNIGQLYTYLGTNNVWIDTGAITECDYPADTKLYIDGLTAPDEDMIANANIASGKYFVVNNQLYLSTAAIAAGASIVPGTNCTATNIAEALNTINT